MLSEVNYSELIQMHFIKQQVGVRGMLLMDANRYNPEPFGWEHPNH